MTYRRIQSTGVSAERNRERSSSALHRRRTESGQAPELQRRPSSRTESRERIHRSSSDVHQQQRSRHRRPSSSRRASIDNKQPIQRSSNQDHRCVSSSHHRNNHRSSTHRRRDSSRGRPDKEKVNLLLSQISDMKRHASQESDFTSSTSKLSSGSEMSSPRSLKEQSPLVGGGVHADPLPFLEKRVTGSSSSETKKKQPLISQECGGLETEARLNLPARPKFIPPKTTGDKSKSKPPSAFREVKDADLQDPDVQHNTSPKKSPVKSFSCITSPTSNSKKTQLSNCIKYPAPPLNKRSTSSESALKQTKTCNTPPPPPPRKQQNQLPLKSALKESSRRKLSDNKNDTDLTALDAQLRQMQQRQSNESSSSNTGQLKRRPSSSTSLHGARGSDTMSGDLSNLNRLGSSNGQPNRRATVSLGGRLSDESDDLNNCAPTDGRRSFGQISMLSLNDSEDLSLKQPAYPHNRASFGQSILSLNDSQDLTLKEPQHSQSVMSFNQSDSSGMMDFAKSEPAGLDHAVAIESSNQKSHRKLSTFFRRRTNGISSPTNQVGRASPPDPSPQSEVRAPPSNETPSAPSRNRKLVNERPRHSHVVNMPYTDPTYGDSGLYTGEVDEDKRPNGKGKMKYDNGIFYEGKWTNGMQDAKNCANRERMLSGFTSWKGQPKTNGEKGCTVYGMEWIDFSGMAGKYTGTVDEENVPNGKGIMKYDFGLIAEGEWIKGVLNGGSQHGQMAGGATVVPGGTVVPGAGGTVVGGNFPGGMSVVGGSGMSVVSGLGMMSISGGPQGNIMPNPMMNQYGCMGGAMMPHQMQQQMQMGPYGMSYVYDMRRD